MPPSRGVAARRPERPVVQPPPPVAGREEALLVRVEALDDACRLLHLFGPAPSRALGVGYRVPQAAVAEAAFALVPRAEQVGPQVLEQAEARVNGVTQEARVGPPREVRAGVAEQALDQE